MNKATQGLRKFSLFFLLFITDFVLAQTGSYTQGINLPKTNFCKTNGCKLIKRVSVPPNFSETYSIKKLGNLYELEFLWLNDKSGWSFSRHKLSKPSSAFVANVKSFLKDAVGLDASKKFSTSRCKTFDQFLKIYTETGISVPDQGLTVDSDGYTIRISCLLLPLTNKISSSERYKYPMVTISISSI